MTMIIETCPKCGYDLFQSVICTYPPIDQKDCPHCGWHWEQTNELERISAEEDEGD